MSSRLDCSFRTLGLSIGSAYRNKALPSVIAFPAGNAALLAGVQTTTLRLQHKVISSSAKEVFCRQRFKNLVMVWFRYRINICLRYLISLGNMLRQFSLAFAVLNLPSSCSLLFDAAHGFYSWHFSAEAAMPDAHTLRCASLTKFYFAEIHNTP